jgi:hypothetical protein
MMIRLAAGGLRFFRDMLRHVRAVEMGRRNYEDDGERCSSVVEDRD